MSIITYNDFKGEQNIPNADSEGVIDNLQWFIDKYEPKFLRSLLGVDLANEFIAGLKIDPIDPKWVTLRDETDIKEMLICYIWYWYDRDLVTTTTGTGRVKSKNENSFNACSVDKQNKSWNDMVNLARLFDLSTTDYPNYVRPYWRRYNYWYDGCGVNEIYYFNNALNI